MSELPPSEAEAAQAFADHLDALSRRYREPLPGAAERLAALLAEHEAECVRLEREEAEREGRARTA